MIYLKCSQEVANKIADFCDENHINYDFWDFAKIEKREEKVEIGVEDVQSWVLDKFSENGVD
jgi:hypothetical protein